MDARAAFEAMLRAVGPSFGALRPTPGVHRSPAGTKSARQMTGAKRGNAPGRYDCRTPQGARELTRRREQMARARDKRIDALLMRKVTA